MNAALSAIINESDLSKSAIAKRAGVSPSTVTRIASGQLDPTFSTAESILRALGHQLPEQFPKLCDVAAVHAARRVIRGEDVEGLWEESLQRWASSISEFMLEAGRAAPLALRNEAVMIRTSWSILRIYGAVAATGRGWVASGWPAGSMLGLAEAPREPLVVYVDGGSESLGLALPEDPLGTNVVRVLPFDGLSELDAWRAEGIVWADPHQVCLDLFADAATEHLGHQLIENLEKTRG